jgi:hypothetical protein
MLSNTLVTNEVKNAAGTEVEFSRISSTARTTEFAQVAETPNLPHRLKISHQEIGSGTSLRRRSVVRFDKTVAGASLTPRTVSAYAVVDAPVGDLSASTEIKNVIAELMSFCASLGASTTILYDGTGNGAVVLVDGGL